MSILFLLVPLALALAGAAACGFVWAVRAGEFEDLETPALRVLLDDEVVAPGRAQRKGSTSSPKGGYHEGE